MSEASSYFELGYSENMGMVTVPVHSPDGMAIGIVGRSIEGKAFKNSTNLPKSKTLFNIHRAKKIGDQVIVVESSFDANIPFVMVLKWYLLISISVCIAFSAPI